MKIVVLDGERANPGDLRWDCLAELGELRVYPHTAPAEMAARIGDSEIVIVDKLEITRSLLEACPSIKMIALFATGFNHIDVEAAKERGIPVCNVPGYSSFAVAQLAAALVLEICTQVSRHNAAVHNGAWTDNSYFCSIGRGKAALGRGIHNKENLAFELSEVKFNTLVVKGLEVINLCHFTAALRASSDNRSFR